ncbi:MAG: PAS domain S-box-containing protein [Candidatus Promineifilaceae bacterium]
MRLLFHSRQRRSTLGIQLKQLSLENIRDGLIVLDLNHQVANMNSAAEAILEGPIKSILGKPVSQIPIIGEADKRLFEQPVTPFTCEIKFDHPDSQVYFEMYVSPILNDHKKIDGTLISLRDITQQKQIEKTQLQRTQTIETLNSLSINITASLDLQLILETVLESITRIFDVTSAYISEYDLEKGTTSVIAEYISPNANQLERQSDLGQVYNMEDDFDLSLDWFNHAGSEGLLYHIDDPSTPNGHRIHMEEYGCKTTFEGALIAQGELLGSIEVWESRYKRVFTSDEVVLILAIARQTAIALKNANLYKALSAISYKSRLVAQVNHELRTPLSVILMYSEMLEVGTFGPLTEKQADTIGKVILNTNYLHALVEQLLAQAEFENGKVQLKTELFSPIELVEQVLTQLKILADKKGLVLSSTIPSGFPSTVTGDREKIYQILMNLIMNALKYTEAGTVHLSLFQTEADSWCLQVSDTGIGIALKDQSRIFDPFWQTDNLKTKLHKNGTGLGLSIVKELINLMSGEITVESEVGKGSIFTVVLPNEPVLMETV